MYVLQVSASVQEVLDRMIDSQGAENLPLAGVLQMDLGILMSYFNHIYFRDRLSLLFEFIPQMIFLNALFGYLIVIIIAKWVTGSTADIYHVLIYMFLQPGTAGLTANGESMENQMFPGQGPFQVLPQINPIKARVSLS